MLQFAGHILDVGRGSLRGGDREIRLRPKSFEVLRYFVENPDRLVSKDELIKAIWPNAVATDESLAQCLSEVRQALGDSEQKIIKTIPRRGYLFVAAVTPVKTAQPHTPPMISEMHSVTVAEGSHRATPALPDGPSIAVLPFQNMSSDPEQDYFADGVVEEIITTLSRFHGLFVIARNSSFIYKGRPTAVTRVGIELGVRYVLEGSIRKAGDRVRITGQLIDSTSGAHLWADRFDGSLENVLDLQDSVTASVVNAIAPRLEQAEITRAKRKSTNSLDAYDYFLRGLERAYHDTRESVSEAQGLFTRAIELDADFAAAHAMAAYCYTLRKASRWMTDRVSEINDAARLANRAVQLGKDDPLSLTRASHTLAFVVRELDAAQFFVDRALTLNPNFASAWFTSGCVRHWLGEPDLAIEHFSRFKRMSPLDPLMPVARSVSAFAHVFCGRYEAAAEEARQAIRESPYLHVALRAYAISKALAGDVEQAQNAMTRLLQIDPALRVCDLGDQTPLRRPEDMALYAEALRIAGLPE
jgi:TolB-like protein